MRFRSARPERTAPRSITVVPPSGTDIEVSKLAIEPVRVSASVNEYKLELLMVPVAPNGLLKSNAEFELPPYAAIDAVPPTGAPAAKT